MQHSLKAPPLISVVICTRNRAELLRRALTSMAHQEFSKSDYEVLVVDNGSTDSTAEVVRQFQGQTPIRYLREDQLGLCVARNTGWQAAGGRYIAYFDDDAVAPPNWLAAIQEGFAVGPEVGVVGGPARPIWEKPRPTWLAEEIVCSLTVIDWGPNAKFIEDIACEWLVGANMAVPKQLLAEIGGFHPWLDRVGNNLLSSGDVFLQKAIKRRGYECLYSPAMVIAHLVPESRLNQKWFFRRYYWQGISDAVMHLIDESPSPGARVRTAADRLKGVFLSEQRALLLTRRTDCPETFAGRCLALIPVGFAAGLLGAARH